MTNNQQKPSGFNERLLGMARAPRAACAALIISVAALAACDAEPTPTPITNPQSTPTVTVSLSPTTNVPPTATLTRAPIVTATRVPPTATRTPEPSPTPSRTPTKAPLPTYTWERLGVPEGTNLRDVALLAGGKNVVVVGSSAGLWRSEFDYTTWQELDVPIAGDPLPANIEVAIANTNVLYVTAHTACASGLPMTSFRSTDGGATWTPMSAELLDVMAAGSTLAYGTTCNGVVKTMDAGATWSAVLPGSEGEGSDPYGIAGGPDGQSIYVAYASEGGSGTMKRSTDAGATWTDITPEKISPDGVLRAAVYMMFVPGSVGRPQDAGLYMANSQGTFFLPTKPDEWQIQINSANAIPEPAYYVTAFYVDTAYSKDYAKNGPVLYEARAKIGEQALEGIGVFRSTNLGATWQQIGDDIGKRPVQGLVLTPHDTTADPAMQEALIAATSDGAWGSGYCR